MTEQDNEQPADSPETEAVTAPEPAETAEPPKPSKHRAHVRHGWEKLRTKAQPLLKVYWAKRLLAIPATVVVVLVVLGLIPATRYMALGLVVKQDMTITVVDDSSASPVSKAAVVIGGTTASTDAKGQTHVHVSVGYQTVAVTKQYYRSYSQTRLVSLSASDNHLTIRLVAIGRLVPVTVTNKLTGKPVAGATVKALNAEAVTATDGTATVVLPVALKTQQLDIHASGFNALTGTLQVTDQKIAANTFAITPSGKVYFLSNQSGKIDVVKTDLDGSNRQTVIAGTGNENDYSTALLASRDWKYLALYAQRKPSGNPEIDLIDTSNDSLSNIDEGDASFNLVGWDGDRFVYQVNRNNVNSWQNGQLAIKSFDATNKKITTLVETSANGDQNNPVYQYFGGVYLLNDKVVYALDWNSTYYYNVLNDKQATLNSVNLDGSNKTVVKSFSLASGTQSSSVSITTAPYYEPNSIAVSFADGNGTSFYAYLDGKVTTVNDIKQSDFYSRNYPTFLLSPSGKQAFWSVYADGKNNLKVGDANAQSAQTIASQSEYSPYGWFTDDYLLMQKSDSELYILSSDGSGQPVKITNYYKPQNSYYGYGGGYGGL